ncbi:MAG: hypothetical protein ACREM3_25375 [Candidatus Rokuibacteriota bacterium]
MTADGADLLPRLVGALRDHDIRFCVVGGQAVNAYVEPVVSLDLDLAVAADQLPLVERLLRERFTVERFSHRLNVSDSGSDLRVQIQLDPRYAAFPERVAEHDVLGVRLPVARAQDVMQGKLWAVQDPGRRASKRQKDLADIARLIEAYPRLRAQIPADVLTKLL